MQNKNIIVNDKLNTQLITHLNNLQNKYSKLLPIRIDIHYTKNDEFNTDMTTAKQEMDYLLSRVMHLELDVVGYAVVMEYNQREHIHFHALLYVNGQKRRQYYPIYLALEKEWRNLTRGYLYDCQRNHYKINGLRMINHQDEEAYHAVVYLLSYLAKEEKKILFKMCYSDALFLSEVPLPSYRGKPRILGLNKFSTPPAM